MPYKNYDDALKYAERLRLENPEYLLAIQRKFYHKHIESERLRLRKKYYYNKECKRLRDILMV